MAYYTFIDGVLTLVDAQAAPTDPEAVQNAALTAAVSEGEGAGGVLGGTYPNPGFAVNMATQAELDAVAETVPVKASGTEVTTGTDDAKFVTAKAIRDSNLGVLPKIYVALWTQEGSSDPDPVSELNNTLGGALVWTRTSASNFTGTLAGAFPDVNKVIIFVKQPRTTKANIVRATANTITMEITDMNDDPIDVIRMPIRIEVYP